MAADSKQRPTRPTYNDGLPKGNLSFSDGTVLPVSHLRNAAKWFPLSDSMTLPCSLSLKGSHSRSVLCTTLLVAGPRSMERALGPSSSAGALCAQPAELYMLLGTDRTLRDLSQRAGQDFSDGTVKPAFQPRFAGPCFSP